VIIKYILVAGVIYIIYRFINPPSRIEKGEQKDPKEQEFTDYEEID